MLRGGRALLADPVEVALNLHAKLAERVELRAKRARGAGGFMPWPPCPYAVDDDWERRMHELLDVPWPCAESERFWELWSQVRGSLEAKRLELGRGAFAGWGDGEPGLVRAVWCLVLHLRPNAVVETGVARGITSRFILEALAHNRRGHLWSIDLPPPLDPALHHQVGVAVPEHLRGNWTYVRGSSRRRLRSLLAQLGEIDMFVHDSRHTERNVLFELGRAWNALNSEGVVVVDDIDLNRGFHSFRSAHGDEPCVVCLAEPLRPDPGRQEDRGVFAVMKKASARAESSR